jgi:hypothetical protein
MTETTGLYNIYKRLFCDHANDIKFLVCVYVCLPTSFKLSESIRYSVFSVDKVFAMQFSQSVGWGRSGPLGRKWVVWLGFS